MVQEELPGQAGSIARHYTHSDTEVIALDFGINETNISVDVADQTAMIRSEDTPENQFDIDLPDGEVDVTINNGIVTITLQ